MSLTNSPRVQPPYQQQPSQQQSQQLIQQRPPRKCAEVCLELLTTEAVKLFSEKQYGPAAPAALQAVGFRVGRQLAERYSKDKARLGDTLEVIKFLCKDFWQAVFKKQIDNLKTNHRVGQMSDFKTAHREHAELLRAHKVVSVRAAAEAIATAKVLCISDCADRCCG
eukprot:GHUV01033079.1.p1 GENE.GHUV01033079.1~~GHUV01033079.1.p1  ORF type:complete len:167 (+),score=38.98 GHUV01033079.1:238-738(+)